MGAICLSPNLSQFRHLTLSVARRKYEIAIGKLSRMARISSLVEAIESTVRDGDTEVLRVLHARTNRAQSEAA
jgi:hypothetical protein